MINLKPPLVLLIWKISADLRRVGMCGLVKVESVNMSMSAPKGATRSDPGGSAHASDLHKHRISSTA